MPRLRCDRSLQESLEGFAQVVILALLTPKQLPASATYPFVDSSRRLFLLCNRLQQEATDLLGGDSEMPEGGDRCGTC
jgi:hypothetical protein